MTELTLDVNGRAYRVDVEPRMTLADAIRGPCRLTGTHVGCEHGVCGACTVIVDGEPVRACLMFAVQARGRAVRTVEGLAGEGLAGEGPAGKGLAGKGLAGNGLAGRGLAQDDALHPVQRAFMEHHGLQCGFCTPGFLMLAVATLEREPGISDAALADVMASNLCRCTGYQNILAAVRAAAARMRAK